MAAPLRIGVAVLVGVVAGACGGGGEGAESSEEAIAAGAKLFADNCASCHGPEGTGGSGPVLKDKRFLENASEEQLTNQIAVGIPRTTMPGWSQDNGGPMTDRQIAQIVAYLKSLEDEAPVVPDRRTPRQPAA